jgi:prepilin peptidase CpaA
MDRVLDICQWGAVLGASLTAALLDLRTQRISNRLTVPLVVSGWLFSAWAAGFAGLADSLAASLLLGGPYVLLFALGQGGAGDAKMMAALGAWLGVRYGLIVLACVAGTGALLGLLRLVVHRRRGMLLQNLGASLYLYLVAFAGGGRGWELLKADPAEQITVDSRQITIPYGVAIFLGVAVGCGLVHLWIS